MKAKSTIMITIVITLGILLSSCTQSLSKATATATSVLPVFMSTATPTNTDIAALSTPVTDAPLVVTVIVVETATGMFDVGSPLGDQDMTPLAGVEIDWPHLLKMDEWRVDTGLSGNPVRYVQSGTLGQIIIPPLEGQEKFIVPANASMVFGAFYGNLVIDGKRYEFSNGFYGVLTEGTTVDSSLLKDGFALLIDRSFAQEEYCARVAQAINEKWARDHLYRPVTWNDPVCTGVITTPLDNDR